ncbi:MAG: putative Ig domain-containing protein [Candidatus Sulfotelmatobacter sp.]
MLYREAAGNLSRAERKFSVILQRIAILIVMGEVLAIGVGCGSSGATPTTQPAGSQSASQVQVAVSPSSVSLNAAGREQFTATVKGTSNSAVTWSASAGKITSKGLFTAPATSSGPITITATSVVYPTQRANGFVTIQNGSLEIELTPPSAALVNTPYNGSLAASGGTLPYTWAITAGSLPSGISMQAATGSLAGTTSQLGQYSFTARVTDAASHSATQGFTLSVVPANGALYDGPAELPLVYLNTTMADTPAPGSTINVAAGGNLQTALNNANCGDTISIQAGANFSAGQYTFPAKSCDDQHWIIVRTSASDSSLPAEGTRMTPCYAGVSSLPGRPVFSCPSTEKVLATISYSGTGDGPIVFANGANHYRLLGLEVTRAANNGQCVTGLITRASDASVSQIVLDRLYIHGTPTDETRRGVDLSGGTSMAVQDSYISEFHCNANGDCVDSQAVAGGNGDQAMGPWKIDDNFLEAAGENILFGGSAATQTPADIEIRFNHFFKPLFWMKGQPGFQAPAFVVKNHFEMKNAQRVLFDSNIAENTWGGFTQHGFSILMNAANQDLGGVGVCPLCQVTDVTIRYSTISHVGGVFVMDTGHTIVGSVPLAGERYSIHDVIADDINATVYAGHGTFAQVGSIASPLLQSIEINHVTAFPPHVLFNIGAPNTVKIPGFIFSNSIVTSGDSALWSTGAGGSANCAYTYRALNIMNQCFSEYTFASNAILAAPYTLPYWPNGNLFYSTSAIGFVNYNNGSGGDYSLLPSSPAIGAASDGTNLGANVAAVESAISGVE